MQYRGHRYVALRNASAKSLDDFFAAGWRIEIGEVGTTLTRFVIVAPAAERPGMVYVGYDRDCDFWYIQYTQAASGWGPFLYDIAMEYASERGRGLVADRTEPVSRAARRVWDYYFEARPDVTHTPLQRGECMRLPGDDDPGPLDHVYWKAPDLLPQLDAAGLIDWR